jgi:nitrite reductase/ring-hydroxylating ferredoxin subunit
VCAGVIDDMPSAGSWTARTVGGLPVLVVRDKAGELRTFLNVCLHRGAPLCEDDENHASSLIRCPYYSWLYQLDGSLARASGVGSPDGFDVADHSLKPVHWVVWRRLVFVCFDMAATPVDIGPLGRAIDAYPLESMELALSETNDRQFAAPERVAHRRDPFDAAAGRARLGRAGVGADGRPVRRWRLSDGVAEPDDERIPRRVPGDVDGPDRRNDDQGRTAAVHPARDRWRAGHSGGTRRVFRPRTYAPRHDFVV